ncbi:MAG TPA: cation:proton antiporter [Gemmatimonadaceae bacterium]|nr:cation:proton antiporter [Gemmatimonadaceae bacterium]
MSAEQLAATLALVGIVIIVASLFSGIVDKTGLPQVAIFLALGAILGPAGFGLVNLTLESPALRVIATIGLVLVLFTDAISVDLSQVKRHRALAAIILGPGTLLPAVVLAAIAYFLLRFSFAESAILGAALASTDPVMLRSVLRKPELPADTRLALKLESGMNDVVLLPIVVLSMLLLQPTPPDGQEVTTHVVSLFLLGPVLGGAVGWIAIVLLEKIRAKAGVRRDYESLYALGIAFTAYAAAEKVGGSGFLAAFAAGLTVAALDIDLCDCFLDYGEATAEMFLLLTFLAFGGSLIWSGLLVIDWKTILFAVAAMGVRTLVLYPVLARARLEKRSRHLIAWLGPRGLSSLLLILLPVFAGLPGTERLFAITSLVVLGSVAIHGAGIALVLRRATLSRVRRSGNSREAVHTPPLDEGPREPVDDKTPELINLEEVEQLQNSGESVVIVDSRADRNLVQDSIQAAGAVRVRPNSVVEDATARRLSQHATLVVYCA